MNFPIGPDSIAALFILVVDKGRDDLEMYDDLENISDLLDLGLSNLPCIGGSDLDIEVAAKTPFDKVDMEVAFGLSPSSCTPSRGSAPPIVSGPTLVVVFAPIFRCLDGSWPLSELFLCALLVVLLFRMLCLACNERE